MLTEEDSAGEWVVGRRLCIEGWQVFVEHNEYKTWRVELKQVKLLGFLGRGSGHSDKMAGSRV